MGRTILVAATTLALAAHGCASAPQGAPSGDVPTRITVENHNPLTVTVDAVSSGEDYRLGQVETTDSETFTLPPTVNAYDLRVLVDPIGSPDTWLSDELVLSPGDLIEVSVEADLDLTTASVR